jgi:hypothetical protein
MKVKIDRLRLDVEEISGFYIPEPRRNSLEGAIIYMKGGQEVLVAPEYVGYIYDAWARIGGGVTDLEKLEESRSRKRDK